MMVGLSDIDPDAEKEEETRHHVQAVFNLFNTNSRGEPQPAIDYSTMRVAADKIDISISEEEMQSMIKRANSEWQVWNKAKKADRGEEPQACVSLEFEDFFKMMIAKPEDFN